MTPNSIRNHCGQHKCNWNVAPGTRTRTGMIMKNDNHNCVSQKHAIDYDAVLYMLHDSNVVSLKAA